MAKVRSCERVRKSLIDSTLIFQISLEQQKFLFWFYDFDDVVAPFLCAIFARPKLSEPSRKKGESFWEVNF